MTLTFTKRLLIVSALLIGFIAVSSAAMVQFDKNLNQTQAIRVAEDFVRSNGYTSALADKAQLKYELLDRYEKSIDAILKQRRNTLHPTAFCVSEEAERWNIGFLSTEVNIAKLDQAQRQTDLSGRAVIVSKDGRKAWMTHKDPLFSHFIKLPQ